MRFIMVMMEIEKSTLQGNLVERGYFITTELLDTSTNA